MTTHGRECRSAQYLTKPPHVSKSNAVAVRSFPSEEPRENKLLHLAVPDGTRENVVEDVECISNVDTTVPDETSVTRTLDVPEAEQPFFHGFPLVFRPPLQTLDPEQYAYEDRWTKG